ncbi:hypothetical protein [Mycobacterium sp. NPDC050041]|uniref:hypothetical protein n=1 Tax=Mycobacterium sp. NPDC050041 TaxID=3364293 RepID=UPI003C2CF582
MTGRPSSSAGEPADEDGDVVDEAALVARVASAQSARLDRPVPTDRDPPEVRCGVRTNASAAIALWFGLAGLDVGFAAAATHASMPCECGSDDDGWSLLPGAMWLAAAHRLPINRLRVLTAAESLADVLPPPVAVDRARVELAAWRVVNRLRDHLTGDEVAALRLRCVDGDQDFELRCLRAGYMSALGRITGDELMTSAAATLAIREGRERPFGGLTIPAVWSVAGPFVQRHGMDVAPDTLAATLRAELVRVDSLMVYPDADVGTV